MKNKSLHTLLLIGFATVTVLTGCTTTGGNGSPTGSASAAHGDPTTNSEYEWRRIRVNTKVLGGAYFPRDRGGDHRYDAYLRVGGVTESGDADPGFDEARFLFYREGKSNGQNERAVISSSRILFVYLKMEEFDRTRELLSTSKKTYVYWVKHKNGTTSAAVWDS